MILNREEREMQERERQVTAIRKYNQSRKKIFDARMNKFLTLYPYAVGNIEQYMNKFYLRVESADADELNILIELFNEENKYWNTYYVMQNCNASIHNHIISILTLMHSSLESKIQKFSIEKDNKDDTQNNNWGKQGEKEVDYVLKWLPNEFFSIEKDCTSKYENECILLKNENFVDEAQEYDHIVVGPQGIFLIETKNYSGKLNIDQDGNWTRLKRGETEWTAELNPIQQVTRHHILIESIVGSDVPIYDIVCLAHPDIIVSGQNNSKVAVVKKDLLGNYIMNHSARIYGEEDVEKLINVINSFKISK